MPGRAYFDTGEQDGWKRTGHFCGRCGQLESMNNDLFEGVN